MNCGVSLRCVERRCPCLRLWCGAVLKRKRRVGFESHCFGAAYVQLVPAIADVCRRGHDQRPQREGKGCNLRFAHILRSSAALAALTGGSQCQRCLGLCRVGDGAGARGGLFCDEAPRVRGCRYCSPGTDLIVCAAGCRWARYVVELRLLERPWAPCGCGCGCVCTCVLPEGFAAVRARKLTDAGPRLAALGRTRTGSGGWVWNLCLSLSLLQAVLGRS